MLDNDIYPIPSLWAVKIKLMGTRIYEVTEGNTKKVDTGIWLMGCFCIIQHVGLVCLWHFIPNTILFLRQPIPLLHRNYWEARSLMRGVWLNHINRGIYVKWSLIPIFGERLNLIDTPTGFIAKLSARMIVLLWVFADERRSSEYWS